MVRVSRLDYSIILLYRSSGDHDEYFDISKFRYNRSSFVLTLCSAGLQIELRYKRNFDISEFDIAGLYCNNNNNNDDDDNTLRHFSIEKWIQRLWSTIHERLSKPALIVYNA